MTHRKLITHGKSVLLTLTLTCFAGIAQAQVPNCIDNAKSSSEVDQCATPLVSHFEERIESDYKRLNEKFTGNEKMQEVLKVTRQSWDHYRSNQCVLEESAANGRYVGQPF